MSRIPPPPKRLQVAPPPLEEAPDNLSRPSSDYVDLNFKVTADFHRRFKTEAVIRGMKMKDFLETCFKHYVATFQRPTD